MFTNSQHTQLLQSGKVFVRQTGQLIALQPTAAPEISIPRSPNPPHRMRVSFGSAGRASRPRRAQSTVPGMLQVHRGGQGTVGEVVEQEAGPDESSRVKPSSRPSSSILSPVGRPTLSVRAGRAFERAALSGTHSPEEVRY